jgi:23S rRNA (cytidine1920-2'-O)/16S rRNA (cytidine1409-2'-O)-methyltransferase
MRIDKYLVENKFFSSRARAKDALTEGGVCVDGVPVFSPDFIISPSQHVSISKPFPWVSRGALKLLHALENFSVSPEEKRVLDLGASTGGFSQVLLHYGAKEVVAVDVGHGQLHESLIRDARVRSLEKTDVRDLLPESLGGTFPLIVIDLSFISLTHILPILPNLLSEDGEVILLVKPQFEVGKGNTKKGIVIDEDLRVNAFRRIKNLATDIGFVICGEMDSPVTGGSGNKEYLLFLRKGTTTLPET